eukprot:2130261-Pyramimonas_sp.AAC.1
MRARSDDVSTRRARRRPITGAVDHARPLRPPAEEPRPQRSRHSSRLGDVGRSHLQASAADASGPQRQVAGQRCLSSWAIERPWRHP